MAPDHDNFVLQLRIGSRYLGNGVEPVFVITREFYIDIQFNRDRDILFEQPVDPPVVLNRHNDHGERLSVLPLVDKPSQSTAAVNKYGSSRAAVLAAITARENNRQGVL